MTLVRQDPRRRNLLILGAVTAVFLLLAFLAVFQQSRSLAPKFEEHPFFPGLADRINNLGEITIASKTGTFHVKLNQGQWVVVERDSFPADVAQVRSLAAGVADLTALEPRTGRSDLLTFLGLGPPDQGGDAIEVKLADTSGQNLADVLVGHAQGTPDELGRTTVFVRKPNEMQAWLARGSLAPKAAIGDWLDKTIVNIARDRVKGATVTPPMGPGYNLARENKDQADFKMTDMPAGRSLSFEGAPDGVAGAIVGFGYDDVAKADQFNFMGAPQSVFHTFDGLDVTVKIATKGMEHWAAISAAGQNPMTQVEAMRINARVTGSAFRLPEMKMEQIVASRETLLRPLDTPASGAPRAAAPAPGPRPGK
jgi:hypothetical protein